MRVPSLPTTAAVAAAALGALLLAPASAPAAPAATPATPSAPAAAPVADGPSAVPPAPDGFGLVWGDDFDGPAGARLNDADWIHDVGTGYPGGSPNWGTGEIETMTDRPENVSLDGAGHLAITPLRDGNGGWTSGRVETRRDDFQPPPGGRLRIEASIKQPDVSGAEAMGYWPAFWALGAPARPAASTNWPGIGEIDILENINGRDSHFHALHCGTGIPGTCNETTGHTSGELPCGACKSDFHTYGVEWDRSSSPQALRFYRDGQTTWTLTRDQVDGASWDNALNHGYFLILNVAVGGGFPGAFGGGPYADTRPGAPMLVDHVAVYSSGG